LCYGCRNCEQRCPNNAIAIKKRHDPFTVKVDPKEVDQSKLLDLCSKAQMNPKQVVCWCTGTLVEEVAAAILEGAKTPHEITMMTGIRTCCRQLCLEPQVRLLSSVGIKIEKAPGWQWYGSTPTIWDIPKNKLLKYSKFYLTEDKKFLERLKKRSLTGQKCLDHQ
jgi:bacterioferritin-associated ferredoxin